MTKNGRTPFGAPPTKQTKKPASSKVTLLAASARAARNTHSREQHEAGVNRAMRIIYARATAPHFIFAYAQS